MNRLFVTLMISGFVLMYAPVFFDDQFGQVLFTIGLIAFAWALIGPILVASVQLYRQQ